MVCASPDRLAPAPPWRRHIDHPCRIAVAEKAAAAAAAMREKEEQREAYEVSPLMTKLIVDRIAVLVVLRGSFGES